MPEVSKEATVSPLPTTQRLRRCPEGQNINQATTGSGNIMHYYWLDLGNCTITRASPEFRRIWWKSIDSGFLRR
jgi:hypothetical protein